MVLGRLEEQYRPDGLLVVVAATHLYQGLYLVEQLLELGLPTMVALTMHDAASAQGIEIDPELLSAGWAAYPVCPLARSAAKAWTRSRATGRTARKPGAGVTRNPGRN